MAAADFNTSSLPCTFVFLNWRKPKTKNKKTLVCAFTVCGDNNHTLENINENKQMLSLSPHYHRTMPRLDRFLGPAEVLRDMQISIILLVKSASTHAAFDNHISLISFQLDTCFSQILKPTGLVSWSQICLLSSIAVFETVRSYQINT